MTVTESKEAFVLRDYQRDCIKAIDDAGNGHFLVSMATGLGKTAIFTHLNNPGRTLIISHRNELVRQPEKYYTGRKTFGIEKADEHAGDEEIVSASVQTLQQDKRLKSFSKDSFDTIIVDEAHHAAAESYRKIIDYFSGARRVVGFTATPRRGDRVGLDKIFERIVFNREIRWGIENNYLSKIRCKQIKSNYSLANINITAGDYSASELASMMIREGIDIIPVGTKTYIEDCYKKGRHTLIYCATKDACSIMLETIQKMLPEGEKDTVKIITGDTLDDERAKILADFQSGVVKGIINCMVLTEGIDLPICDTILNLRPTCNSSLYQQIVGRGTRIYEGKEYCLILDVVPKDSNVHRSLCTAPTLFGIDPSLLDEATKRRLNEKEDLLELCNGLSETFASITQKIELQRNTVNLFIEDTEGFIQNLAQDGIKKIAEEYLKIEQAKRMESDDIDFGNLDVRIQADEERYYCIKPNWNEEIFMSKPDVLDMVRIEFDLEYGKILCGTMKLDDAVRMIRAYCDTMPSFYGYSWNKDMQEKWLELDATETQESKIRIMYKKLGVSIETLKNLNKLEASRLIDLANRLSEAKKYAEALALYYSPKQTQKVAKAKQLVNKELEKRNSIKPNDKEFVDLEKKLDVFKGKEPHETEKQNSTVVNDYREVRAVITIKLPENTPASGRQMQYIHSLYDAARRNGCQISRGVPVNMTMREASTCIALLKKIGNSREFKNADFGDIWAKCKEGEKVETGTVAFRYRLM